MIEIDTILSDLETARADLIDSLDDVTDEDLARPPAGAITDDEQRWPIVQVLWHIGQVEDRFRRIIDLGLQGRMSAAGAFSDRPAHMTTPALLREWLGQTRRPTEVLLRRMTDADLDVEIARADGSTRTPRRYLTMIVNHDHDHATQVRALRALDPARAVEMPAPGAGA